MSNTGENYQKIYLELSSESDNTHKFYEIEVNDKTVEIKYGRIGTVGKSEKHEFSDAVLAKQFTNKKIKEKSRKGYEVATEGNREKRAIAQLALGREKFWEIIEETKEKTFGDVDEHCELIGQRLKTLSQSEIFDFQKIVDELMSESYRTDLWGAAYIINGGCSDDGFDYFCGWLILQGKEHFEMGLENPDNLAEIVNTDMLAECEDFLSVAEDAYEEKTGKDDFYDKSEIAERVLKGDFSDWSDGSGDTDAGKVKKLYPRLYKVFLRK